MNDTLDFTALIGLENIRKDEASFIAAVAAMDEETFGVFYNESENHANDLRKEGNNNFIGSSISIRTGRKNKLFTEWSIPSALNILGEDCYCGNLSANLHEAYAKARLSAGKFTSVDIEDEAVGLRDDGTVVQFGKHKGEFIRDLPNTYIEWVNKAINDNFGKFKNFKQGTKATAAYAKELEIRQKEIDDDKIASGLILVEAGRQELKGTVHSVKVVQDVETGETLYTKILIQCVGFRAFGSCPSDLADIIKKGDEICIRGTVTPKEIGFCVYKRPSIV